MSKENVFKRVEYVSLCRGNFKKYDYWIYHGLPEIKTKSSLILNDDILNKNCDFINDRVNDRFLITCFYKTHIKKGKRDIDLGKNSEIGNLTINAERNANNSEIEEKKKI